MNAFGKTPGATKMSKRTQEGTTVCKDKDSMYRRTGDSVKRMRFGSFFRNAVSQGPLIKIRGSTSVRQSFPFHMVGLASINS